MELSRDGSYGKKKISFCNGKYWLMGLSDEQWQNIKNVKKYWKDKERRQYIKVIEEKEQWE